MIRAKIKQLLEANHFITISKYFLEAFNQLPHPLLFQNIKNKARWKYNIK